MDIHPPKRISSALSWLTDKRARLDVRAAYLQEVIASVQRELPDVVRRRAAFDIAIAKYSTAIDVAAIAPIAPSLRELGYGELTKGEEEVVRP